MPRKKQTRTVWCPSCDHPRETAAMRGCRLACPNCGEHYRAPADESDEDLPEARTAPASGPGPAPKVRADDAAAWGRRGGGGSVKARLRRG